MLFKDHIALVNESRDYMKAKLKRQREALESKGFKISHTKIERLDCNFSGHIQRAKTTVRIEAQEIPQRDSFCYLSLIISKNGEINKDVGHRIKAG